MAKVCFLIHPSVSWPLPGHPKIMKKSYRQGYFHTSAWNKYSRKFALTEFSKAHLIPFNTNILQLSDTPAPLTGVCCTRYVGPDKARRYRAHEQIPSGPIGGIGSRRRRWSTGRRERGCR